MKRTKEVDLHYPSKRDTTIWITTQFEGRHRWAKAPKDTDEAFLRNMHRHMFRVKVSVQVFHNDRDIEFFQLKHFVDNIIFNAFICKQDTKVGIGSCEMIAEVILNRLFEDLHKRFLNRNISVEVSEDGENGAIVTHNMIYDVLD